MHFFRRAPLFAVLILTGILFTAAAVVGRRNGYYDRYAQNGWEKPFFTQVFLGIHDKVYPWGASESKAEQEAQALLADNSSTEEAAAEASTETAAAEETGAAASTEAPAVDWNLPASSTNEVVQAVDYGNSDPNYVAPKDTVWERDTDPSSIFATNGTYYPLQQVDDSYFKDAIFIGDSRTEGLYVYSSMRNGITTFDAKDSVTIYGIYDTALDFYGVDGTTGSKTAMEALQEKQYRKVYFSVGVNELGMPTKDYFEHYKEFIQVIRKLQPDAIIYVEGIMHVTGSYAKSNSVYNNTNIVGRNEALSTLANGRDIFYIDMNSAVCDADGNLPEDISYDGVHLKASAYETWHQFLLQNAAVRNSDDWTPQAQGDAASGESTGTQTPGTDTPAADQSAETTGTDETGVSATDGVSSQASQEAAQ